MFHQKKLVQALPSKKTMTSETQTSVGFFTTTPSAYREIPRNLEAKISIPKTLPKQKGEGSNHMPV